MIKRAIPHLLTLGNLFCGLMALRVLFSDEPNATIAAWYVIAAMGFDFLDGFVARLLGVSGPLGKQLDSLADVVTFGVVPSFILYYYMQPALADNGPYAYGMLPFLVALFSALRLAMFNVDSRQTSYFIGMPTPANALAIVSIPLILSQGAPRIAEALLTHPYFLAAYSVLCSLWLVAPVPLFSLKIKKFTSPAARLPIIFLILTVLLLVLFRFTAIPIVILLYLVLSWLFFDPKKHEIQS